MLAPGDTIGILGGGQLGRMLAMAAAQLGFDVVIFTDETDSPAARVAAQTFVAPYTDRAALAAFARSANVVTTEFENVPAETVAALVSAGAITRPNAQALAIAQDRFDEKAFFNAHGIPTPPFAPIASQTDLNAALEQIGAPAILKTRRLGYDGRGQIRLTSGAGIADAFERLGAPGILEGFCAFEREVSIIVAKSANGDFAAYDLCENEHTGGVLSRTTLPARIEDAIHKQALDYALRVVAALDFVGVLTVEFFVLPGGALVANEMAPRVHNSGHWTIEGAQTSQFEQHIRAIAGWPLGSTRRIADVQMVNLLGEDVQDWRRYLETPGAHLHLYGKRDTRTGRKMGHVTTLQFN